MIAAGREGDGINHERYDGGGGDPGCAGHGVWFQRRCWELAWWWSGDQCFSGHHTGTDSYLVPKIIAVFVAMVVFGPWMLRVLVSLPVGFWESAPGNQLVEEDACELVRPFQRRTARFFGGVGENIGSFDLCAVFSEPKFR